MAGNALVIADVARRVGAALLDPSENKTHEFRMEVRSESSSRKYVVARRKGTGGWECSCMGWIRHRHCKHLDVMVPLLEAAAVTPPRRIGR